MDLQLELQALLNKHSRESASNTPDFILAQYLVACLNAFDIAVAKREGFLRPSGERLV